MQPAPAACIDKAFDNIAESSYRCWKGLYHSYGSLTAGRGELEAGTSKNLQHLKHPLQGVSIRGSPVPHGWAGEAVRMTGETSSLSHTMLVSCLLCPCLHLGHIHVAPPPQEKMGTWSRGASWSDNSCLSLQRRPRGGGCCLCVASSNYNTCVICSPLVCLSCQPLILLLFSEVPVRYRGLSKHPRDNHSDCLRRGDRHRREGQQDPRQQHRPDPAAFYVVKFGCMDLTVVLTLAAVTEPQGWGVNWIGSPRLINLSKLLNPAWGDSLLQG